MSDRSGSQSEPVTGPPLFWRIRHAPATAMAAMALFLVLSCLWLVAAATAQVWYHSAPSNYVFASRAAFYVWVGFGVAGTVLMLSPLVRRLWPICLHQVRVILAVCLVAAAEVVLVHVITDHSMTTAPLGSENSGEGACAIALLSIAQPVLVAALALMWSRWATTVRPEQGPVRRSHRSRSGLLALVGMVVTCGAFAAWSLYDRTTLIVNTNLIASRVVTNVGAWWPGVFAAMACLVVVAVVCAPGVIERAGSAHEPATGPAKAGRLVATGPRGESRSLQSPAPSSS